MYVCKSVGGRPRCVESNGHQDVLLYFKEPTKSKPLMKASESMFGVVGVYRCTRSFFRNQSDPELLRIIIYLKGIGKSMTRLNFSSNKIHSVLLFSCALSYTNICPFTSIFSLRW